MQYCRRRLVEGQRREAAGQHALGQPEPYRHPPAPVAALPLRRAGAGGNAGGGAGRRGGGMLWP
jgi:hypothetical protein